jgi:hypothetical protein
VQDTAQRRGEGPRPTEVAMAGLSGKIIAEEAKALLRPLSSKVYFFTHGEARKRLSLEFASNRIAPSDLKSPFFVVATRGNLHVVKLCLRYIPSSEDCVIVLNGLEGWERTWARHNLKAKGFITFPFRIDHGMVIDYLISWLDQPFGLLDEDCFIFESDCFERIKRLRDKTAMASYFFYRNRILGMAFPETVFLYVNTPVVKQMARRYRLKSVPIGWEQLPPAVKKRLSSIGIGAERLPEDYKPYFDTLRVLMAICLADDYEFCFPDVNHHLPPPEIAFHVGAIASVPLRGVRMHVWDAARGAYFWYKALESTDDSDIRHRYYAEYGHSRSHDLLQTVPSSAREKFERNGYLEAVDRVVCTHQSPE